MKNVKFFQIILTLFFIAGAVVASSAQTLSTSDKQSQIDALTKACQVCKMVLNGQSVDEGTLAMLNAAGGKTKVCGTNKNNPKPCTLLDKLNNNLAISNTDKTLISNIDKAF